MKKIAEVKMFCGQPNVIETAANEWFVKVDGVEIDKVTQSSWGDGIVLTIVYYVYK